jgi:hypothetical protein
MTLKAFSSGRDDVLIAKALDDLEKSEPELKDTVGKIRISEG